MIIPEKAIGAALEKISGVTRRSPIREDRELACDILTAAAPHICAAERERLRGLIDPAKLELLALWFDQHDDGAGADPEVQRDLRRWANVLRAGAPAPRSVSDVFADAAVSIGLVPAGQAPAAWVAERRRM